MRGAELVLAIVLVLVGPACGRLGFTEQTDAGPSDGLLDGTRGDAIQDVPLDGTQMVDGPAAISCGGLATTCGPAGTGSCCESSIVPGGTYARSYDIAADAMFPNASYSATVSTFRLDNYEVTVGRFRQFVTAGQGTQANVPLPGMGAHPNIPSSGWNASWNANLAATSTALVAAVKCAGGGTWTDAPGAGENRAMDCLTWYEAMAFCAWDGGFVPTEAEWNYAAAGGAEQRAYPWSSPPGQLTIDETRGSYFVDATKQCFGDGVNGCALSDIIEVGTRPVGDGRWGQADLVGNLWEWTLDWYASPYPQSPCTDCANLTPGTFRVLRGAGFGSYDTQARTAFRGSTTSPTARFNDVGVRCARVP